MNRAVVSDADRQVLRAASRRGQPADRRWLCRRGRYRGSWPPSGSLSTDTPLHIISVIDAGDCALKSRIGT